MALQDHGSRRTAKFPVEHLLITPSLHAGTWQAPPVHTPLWQSPAPAHTDPLGHFGHGPPQSSAASGPFFTPSKQVGI
jgi:hypothetical protein